MNKELKAELAADLTTMITENIERADHWLATRFDMRRFVVSDKSDMQMLPPIKNKDRTVSYGFTYCPMDAMPYLRDEATTTARYLNEITDRECRVEEQRYAVQRYRDTQEEMLANLKAKL